MKGYMEYVLLVQVQRQVREEYDWYEKKEYDR